MPGRMIDRAALSLLCAAGLYALFLNAGAGIPLSCAASLVCMALLRYLWRYRPGARRITAARAEASLLAIVLRGDAEALRALSGRPDGVILPRHPEGALTLNEVFEIWRAAGDGAAIVASCDVDAAAVGFARARHMEILDRRFLVKRIQTTGLYLADEPPREAASRRVARAWGNVRPGPRAIACAASLLAAYLATGRGLCLYCALALTGIVGAKWIEQSR